ncbi:wall-associated receptor kinase-like 14 [Diospyros lotus]|uniref:wall-associated receptor kinase-like 14 n=1 Tax=Diospyros lotus TaxID=55363 RepID=UPI002251BF54|nr:wall-associated receptor kinase-like 14 [Diospyros lotus]
MITKPQAIVLLVFRILFPVILASAGCDHSCGGSRKFPFPFGFSAGCPIRLNCTANGAAAVGEFTVQRVTSDSIRINLPAKCGRPILTAGQLFGPNYAPTTFNGILLQNCSSEIAGCFIPSTMVQTNFQMHDCDPKNNKTNAINCYSQPDVERDFIDYRNLTSSGCQSLFSAISVNEYFGNNNSAVSLDVQLVKLGWWLEGNCTCSENANCTKIKSPVNRRRAHRCQCLEGFVGDGFQHGLGCRKAPSTCGPARYVSGRCGGAAQFGILVGGVAAGAALMVGVGLICCLVRRHSRQKLQKRTTRQLSEATGIAIPIYPYKEIEKATDFFSPKQLLGSGAYGHVYVGKLHNDEWAAIKRIKHGDFGSVQQVVNEIKLISSVSHPNLVRLLGCSIDNAEQILVYEFMPNGTLSQHLHGERTHDHGLPWPVRLAIATDTAQAIAYLHSAMNPPIFHRDIKSSNILLDYDFKSKVADFGLSRLGMTESSHISTAPQGTPGYLDPQYHQNFYLSDKSDVYSFGVVLVEIITALKAVDFSRPQNELNLAALAIDRIGKGRLDEIIDPRLKSERNEQTLSLVHKVAELAFRCLAYDKDMRPSMKDVAAELEQIRLRRSPSLERNLTASSDASSSSCSWTSSGKPLKVMFERPQLDCATEREKDDSPVSVQDLWLSEQSSPSSNSLLGHAVQ